MSTRHRAPLGPEDLVLCAGTLLQTPIVQRMEAARAAGFTAISLWAEDYEQARASGLSPADVRAMLDDHGLSIGELDGVSQWLPAGDDDGGFGHRAEELFAVADAVGGRSLNVFEMFGREVPDEVAAEAFAGVCDRAREHGLLVHLEFLPWSAFPNAARAWEIVRLAGRENGGLLIDTWHHIRSNEGHAALRAVPGSKIFAVQLADAPSKPDGELLDETLRRRRLPGDGDGDLAALLRQLREQGCVAPIGVEVFSDELSSLAPGDAAARAWRAASQVVARARGRASAAAGG
jgi:sugar phosphate isomerase/epimerase